ncbi:isocitrate lyase/PEP mutase family protein [Polymorphobacter sp.]|uniref:isocitrate lyase/PEP mutase family protein n=1 Tax=Polymorphobacter sp. TaxID=1909290 RepID=UPI003F6F9389
MTRSALKAALDAGDFIAAPGLYDMISAVVANKIGFDFVYASGYWLTASGYGLPDAGIVSYTQMLDRVATLCRTVNAGVIADADTGFGGLLNVHHTVRGYEAAGVAAIQIEDQEFPKKCGHTPNKRVIAPQDMAEKVRVACAARSSPEAMLVIARTDARQPEGFDAAIARANLYAEAGADIVFVEALHSEDEMRAACAAVRAPMMANMAHGGQTPILTPEALKAIGYSLAIYPAMTALSAAAAVEKSLATLKRGQIPSEAPGDMFNFSEFNTLIGFEDVWAFEKKWAKVPPLETAG